MINILCEWVGSLVNDLTVGAVTKKNDQFFALVSKTNCVTTESTKEFSIFKDIAKFSS